MNFFIKIILSNKLLWTGIITLLFLNTVVNANKESQSDLLDEYYGVAPTDTVKKADKVYISTKADSIINFARTLIGKNYSYGEMGPDAFDCSGYICFVFREFDVSLPRSSRIQSGYGVPVKKEEIMKGDLLFFESPSPESRKVGHVGIVVENKNGNIRFIHSSTGRGVVIDDLKSRYYDKRFIEARRVLVNN